MCKTINEQLNDLLERNYEDFKGELLTMSKEDIFKNARSISAIEDVLFFTSTHDWLNEDEAAFLLSLDCPLAAMAAAWEDYKDDEAVDFRAALDSVLGPDDDYPDDAPDIDDDDWRSVFEE